MKLKWTKCPSVTREGKSFYVATLPQRDYPNRVRVLQSWLTNLWFFELPDGTESKLEFKTAKQAIKAAEAHYAGTCFRLVTRPQGKATS